jgi:hypothetical protein
MTEQPRDPEKYDCKRDVQPAPSITKTTTLDDYYATGDNECFCFDKCNGPYAHWQNLKENPRHERWVNGDEPEFDPDHCRVYPNDLLPEGVKGRHGTWSITVTFTPTEGDHA